MIAVVRFTKILKIRVALHLKEQGKFPQQIFTKISLSANFTHFRPIMIKKCVR